MKRIRVVLDLPAEQHDSADPKRQSQPAQQRIPRDEQAHPPQPEVEQGAGEQEPQQVNWSHVDARVKKRVDVVPLGPASVDVGEQNVDDAEENREDAELPLEFRLNQEQIKR